MKKTLLLILFFNILLWTEAENPNGYYNAAEGKSGSALYSALESIITNGQSVTSYSGLWTAYKTTDVNASGKIWDMYSNCSFTISTDQCGTYSSECDCYNREHTSPQSWFGSSSPMYSDLFNVYPTDGKVNGMRSNYPYGEVGKATYTSANGSKLGSSDFSGYSGTVFEPIDEYKGDFARTYFYMATRYASICQNWTGNATAVYGSNFGLTTYATNLFLKWSREDPVSDKEIARNNAVYDVQNNRNPFIDYPGLEEILWGGGTSVTFSTTGVYNLKLVSPLNGTTIDFGNVAYQHSDTASVYIKGQNLTEGLTLTLSGASASEFSLPINSITAAQANAGYRLIITYNANTVATSEAQLIITGTGISATVNLTASSTDDFVALAATGITSDGFTANWTSSPTATGYTLDVYSRKSEGGVAQTLFEDDFDAGIPTNWTTEGYAETSSLSSNIRMASGSNDCKLTSTAYDMSQPTVITIKSKQYKNDGGAKLWVIANTNDTITSFVNSVSYQTFTYNIPAKTNNSTITLIAYQDARVYLDYMKLTTVGSTLTDERVAGYPKSVGDVLSYQVTSLENDSTYYYTVTPEGNSTGISDVISVRTSMVNSVRNLSAQNICWYANATGVILKNVPVDSEITLYNTLGKKISETSATSGTIRFSLVNKGVYLLRIEYNNAIYTGKIVY
ncbi:MAG: endonuclease [Paludibacter sp.]|nr:endonuclease [Paludibacter sp.]